MSKVDFDPILVEVLKNELAAITEEMAIAMWRTARSSMVKAGDCATALADAKGRLIAQGRSAVVQSCNFIELMPYVLKKWGDSCRPGDIYIVNDPYQGMTHMPDVAVVSPLYSGERLVAWALAYSH